MVRTRTGHNRLRCDLGSRSRECIGSVRVSAPKSQRVLNLQIQLRRHCSGLPSSFTDGKMGPQTTLALAAFQRANNLTADGLYGPNTEAALRRSPNGLCRIN
ncbi:MAG: peptidoglycan-binding domain-containing protein [Pseudomonadota bacterium]